MQGFGIQRKNMKNIKAGWKLIFYTDYIGCEIYICRDISTNVGFYNCKIYCYAKKKKNIGQKYNAIKKILGTGLEPYIILHTIEVINGLTRL